MSNNQTLAPDWQQEASLSVAELDQILLLQQFIFSKVANNDSCLSILTELCLMAEKLLPNAVASIMLLDSQTGLLSVLCAPSVPQAGLDALQELKPGNGGGSCANAVYSNQPVFVVDTFTDPRWENIRHIAVDFNLCACWSVPIRNETGEAIGSFALSSFEHRLPSEFHKRLLELGASMVSVVLAGHKQECSLAEKINRLELLDAALNQTSEGVVITDIDNRIVETNRAFEQLTGFKQSELLGKTTKLLSSGKHDSVFYQKMWSALRVSDSWRGEITGLHKDGSELNQWLDLSVIKNSEGRVTNHVAVFTDLTELKEGQKRLLCALELDQLTGLPNKAKLSMLLGANPGEQALLMLNVDNFSYINTAYGLEFGDKLLKAIALRLTEVSPIATVFRINADEFALYFDRPVDLAEVVKRVQKYFSLHQTLVGELSFHITFSCGGACSNEAVFRKALQALRKARESGRNHFHIYNQAYDEPDQAERLDYIHWNGLLHNALNEGRLVPYYQGIRDNRSGEIVKYEALVRLEHNGEVYSPYLFLKAARLSGLMPAIAKLMIDQSFAAIADKTCALSINITEEDLNQEYLDDYLEKKAQQYGIEPQRVTLEILEGVSSAGKINHIQQLSLLKSRGYQLAIDDFGTEYSNFERILELNVDYVKIDAKYIKDIAENNISYEVARAIVYFAKNAGIATVAEFVHNEAVQAVVQDLGIEYSQGYLFSEPGRVLPA